MVIKELEDFDWFPPLLRRWQSEYIGYLSALLHLYPTSEQIIIKESCIHDLCSGSGNLAQDFAKSHNKDIIKSDKFPTGLNVVHQDIFDLKPDPKYCYSIINAFHHFTSEEQKQIINRFVDNKAAFIIVELLTPDVWTFLKVLIASVALQPLLSLFIKPFSLFRIITSTILPINIFTVLWDGCISVLKSNTIPQYSQRLNLDREQYDDIRITKIRTKYKLPITVITNCNYA